MTTEPRAVEAARHVMVLPYGLHAPAVARHGARRWLEATAAPDRIADAVLVVSELVTNVIRHTRGRSRLVLTLRDGWLDIAVTDYSESLPDVDDNGAVLSLREGGYGLRVVRRLSHQLRVVPAIGGKTVHAVLDLRT